MSSSKLLVPVCLLGFRKEIDLSVTVGVVDGDGLCRCGQSGTVGSLVWLIVSVCVSDGVGS